nr:hypothetical protein RSP673_16515 [Ralstonia solanacearum P673]
MTSCRLIRIIIVNAQYTGKRSPPLQKVSLLIEVLLGEGNRISRLYTDEIA